MSSGNTIESSVDKNIDEKAEITPEIPSEPGEESPSTPINIWAVGLIALMMVLTMQVLRAFGVLVINNMGWWHGEVIAGGIIALVMFSPLLAPILAKRLGSTRAFALVISLLALVRLVIQIVQAPQHISPLLAWLGLGLALLSWALAILWLRGAEGRIQAAYTIALGWVLGLALDTSLHSAYLTWDYLWQSGALPIITALVVSGLVWFLAWQQRKVTVTAQEEAPLSAQLSLAVLPPLVLGYAFYWQNTAMLSAALGVGTAAVTALLLLMNAGVLVALQRFGGSEGSRLRFGLSLIVVLLTLWLIPIADGVMLLTLTAMAQWSALLLLHEGLVGRIAYETFPTRWRTAMALFGGNVLLVLLGAAYYVRVRGNYFSELAEVPVLVAGALLVLVTVLSLQWGTSTRLKLAPILPLFGLIVPVLLILMQPEITTQQPSETLRVMTYNTHYSVGMDGWPSVEEIAQAIEAQDADIVMLQETSRGRLNSGSVDMAEWLSQRLQMPFAYAPAGDYQQGVTTLSRVPIYESTFEALPMAAEGEQRRYLMTTHPLPDGETLRVINTHLAAAWLDASYRLPQFSVLLDLWNEQPRTVIAGDLNTPLDSTDVGMMLSAGMVSAQDTIGDPDAGTVSADYPRIRYDWILASPDISFADFMIPSTLASDHLPVAVTITVP